jgi:hypothetical protein
MPTHVGMMKVGVSADGRAGTPLLQERKVLLRALSDQAAGTATAIRLAIAV